MNKNCEIARDLMPLVIDSAASENSKTFVDEHIKECPDCKNFFEGMKAALPIAQSEQEKKEFNMIALGLKRKRLFKIGLYFLLGVMIAMMMLGAWQYLAVDRNTELPLDEYDVSLYQLESGRVVMITDFSKTKRYIGGGTSGYTSDNGYCLYVDPMTTILPIEGREGYITNETVNIDSVDVICKGHKRSEIVWQKGDEIAKASKEMEEYFKIRAERLLYELDLNTAAQTQFILNGESNYVHPGYDDPKLNELKALENELYKLVPEWNK